MIGKRHKDQGKSKTIHSSSTDKDTKNYLEVYKFDFSPIIFRFDHTTDLSFQVGHHLKCQKISRSSKYNKIGIKIQKIYC